MSPAGELIVRASIWLALLGYLCGTITFLLSTGNRHWDGFARIAWTIGCVFLICHVAAAYHFQHDWSHESALEETARQTDEIYGLNWSGGLYVNFFLLGAWMLDVVWWWRGIETYRRRSKVVSIAWHFFLLFIFFNATVVFAGGMLRWLGVLFTLIIILLAMRRLRIPQDETPSAHKNALEINR